MFECANRVFLIVKIQSVLMDEVTYINNRALVVKDAVNNNLKRQQMHGTYCAKTGRGF